MTPSNLQAKIDFLSSQIHQKRQWLADHGPGTKRPWPENDIEAKERHLTMLEAIRVDYEQAQKRGKA
ncbi:hypothetical protein V6R85_01350 [Agrobacterium sp. CCNWLW32]|uniref:hypothetical protein n=1 Tax=Agrobacterium sp. CCNWLW32 TaxID=3122072 RepID=UPI00300F952B